MANAKQRKHTNRQSFDTQQFLESAGAAKRIVKYGRSETVFVQGDAATSIMYVQDGTVKLSVLS